MSVGQDKYEARRKRELIEEQNRLHEAEAHALFLDAITAFLKGEASFVSHRDALGVATTRFLPDKERP